MAWALSLPTLAIPATSLRAGRPLFGMGPLCRDSKGIARPCPPGQANTGMIPRDRPIPVLHAPHAGSGNHVASPSTAHGGTRAGAAIGAAAAGRRPLFGIVRMCRDGKGIAKPCD